MNYIRSLKAQLQEHEQTLAKAKEDISSMLSHLNSPKFQGFESGGARKDWIATGDMVSFLRELRSTLTL